MYHTRTAVMGIGDTMQIDIRTGKFMKHFPMGPRAKLMGFRGKNPGRVFTMDRFQCIPGKGYLIHMKDTDGSEHADTPENVFVVGDTMAAISLPIFGEPKIP